jgi:hypothetical protein
VVLKSLLYAYYSLRWQRKYTFYLNNTGEWIRRSRYCIFMEEEAYWMWIMVSSSLVHVDNSLELRKSASIILERRKRRYTNTC